MTSEKQSIKFGKANVLKLTGIALSLLVSLVFLLSSVKASAQDCQAVELSWITPTTRADGSALPVGEIKAYQLSYRRADTDVWAFVEIAPERNGEVIDDMPCVAGDYEFAIATVDTGDRVGEATRTSVSYSALPVVTTPNYASPPTFNPPVVYPQITQDTICDQLSTEIVQRTTCIQNQ